jgi:hypothetical protein
VERRSVERRSVERGEKTKHLGFQAKPSSDLHDLLAEGGLEFLFELLDEFLVRGVGLGIG